MVFDAQVSRYASQRGTMVSNVQQVGTTVISRAALPLPNVRPIPILLERGLKRDAFVLRCLLPFRGNITGALGLASVPVDRLPPRCANFATLGRPLPALSEILRQLRQQRHSLVRQAVTANFLEPSASSHASTPPETRGFVRLRNVFGFRAGAPLRPYPDNSPASSAIEFGEDANHAELGGDAA